MSRVGEKIKEARLKSGMTQKALAKKLGVAEKYINEVEMGRKVVQESFIDRAAKILKVDLNDVSMVVTDEALMEERKNDGFFFISSYREFDTLVKAIRGRFQSYFGDGQQDRSTAPAQNYYNTVITGAENRFKQSITVYSETGRGCEDLTIWEYFLAVEYLENKYSKK